MVNGTEVAVRCYPMAIRHRDSTQSRERDGGKGSKRTVYRSSWCSHGLFWPLLEKNLSYISLYVFVHNCQQPLNKITGPLTATEISAQRLLWIKWAQQQGPDHKNFHENEQQLNLQKNEDGLLECRGRNKVNTHFSTRQHGLYNEGSSENACGYLTQRSRSHDVKSVGEVLGASSP